MDKKPTYDELAARVERLREALIEVSGINLAEPTKRLEDRQSWNRAKKAFESTPAQSLNHIKAQVEEETIEHFCNYVAHELGLDLTSENVADYERKYSNQSEAAVKDGE